MHFGNVETLWRYPVKSLLGEKLNTFAIESRGVAGDRVYAVSDQDGKFGSGKNTRRFRRIDGLFSMCARTLGDEVAIKFPDGELLVVGDQSIDSKLTKVLGQRVSLTKESVVSHFDDGAIHLLTTASLSLLHRLVPKAGIDARRFRPNIVVDSEYYDEDLIGKTIRLGTAVLEITDKTERCRMVTIEQLDLESRPEILKSISKDFSLDFGVYARVLTAGLVSVVDRVEFVG